MNYPFYPRKIYPELAEHLTSDDVTIITGMRRTGKTTLVKHLLSEIDSKNQIFFDLEKISNRDIFSDKNYDNVIAQLKRLGLSSDERMYVAIDEIQTMPNIPSVIKYLHDHYNIKFILTGSSSYYLKNLFSESLAGRKKLFEVFPLDFGEFLTFKNIPHQETLGISEHDIAMPEYQNLSDYYAEYVEYGGFPSVVLASSIKEKLSILDDIMSSYINIDIKGIADFKDSAMVINIAKMLAGRIGSRLDYTKISRLTGVSRPTVVNYVELFEHTYLISLVPVFSSNQDREIVKAKKVYFTDHGLASILAQVSSGSKFENAVFNQLRRKGDVRYFSLKKGQEIDFIFDNKTAYEVKETPTTLDERHLARMAQIAGVTQGKLIGRNAASNFTSYIWGGSIT